MLDESAVRALLRIFGYAARNRPDGNLAGMTGDDIEIVARWSPRRKGRLIAALVELNFLEQNGADLLIHSWLKHQPYLADRGFRSDRAKKAARTRWNRHSGASETDKSTILRGCSEHAGSMLYAPPSNARSNARIYPDRIDPKRESTLTPKGRKRKPETEWPWPESQPVPDWFVSRSHELNLDPSAEWRLWRGVSLSRALTYVDWKHASLNRLEREAKKPAANGNGKAQTPREMPPMIDELIARQEIQR